MRDPWYLINYGSNANEFRTYDYGFSRKAAALKLDYHGQFHGILTVVKIIGQTLWLPKVKYPVYLCAHQESPFVPSPK